MIEILSTEEFHKFLENKIINYNSTQVPVSIRNKPSEKICYSYKEDSEIQAGISLEYFFGIMHINFLWVDDSLRGKGIGEKLLKKAEELALEKECQVIYLETFSFQAPYYYEKFGFTTFGILENVPENDMFLFFMRKKLRKED